MKAIIILALLTVTSLAAGVSIQAFDDLYENEDVNVDETCKLNVTDESRIEFTRTILRRDYNFMYMELKFLDINQTVPSTDSVIWPHHWIWTYKGAGGGHEYLFIPQDFGYLSFGLLWSKCNSSQHKINITHSGNCSGLTVGKKKSDQLIGDAMGAMTSDIATRKDRYNSSYWCYYTRLYIKPSALNYACSNSICPLQDIEFRCCKYVIDFVTRNRSIECSKQHYYFDDMWWALPIISGNICFALYPLFLSTIGRKLHKHSKRSKSIEEEDGPHTNAYRAENVEFIRLGHGYPVTLLKTLFDPFLKIFDRHERVCTRLLRTLVIVVPLLLPAIRIWLDAIFAADFITDALNKGATVGLSSIVAGYDRSRCFLRLLGGPYVALSLYFVFGIMFVIFPSDLEAHLVKGLFEPTTNPYFILTIPVKHREKLGRVHVRTHSGYKRFHHYLLLHLYMILNRKFWRQVFRILVHRWLAIIYYKIQNLTRKKSFAFIVVVLIFPVYALFCIVETLFSLVYFAVPVVSCFYIIFSSYIIAISRVIPNHSVPLCIARVMAIIFVSIAFCITWYMYCIIFYDGFFFLSRILMFTFTGLIQFPELSYGYIILAFMAFYYVTDSFNNFGSGYRDLLKLSIEVCEKVVNQRRHGLQDTLVRKKSIPLKLFNIIVERHQPKRVQVCKTILKVATLISALHISIDLLITFDQISKLSLITHVFTVLFICALPKILRDMCLRRIRHRKKKILRQRTYQTVVEYCNMYGYIDESSNTEAFSTRLEGYERFNVESD